MKSLLLTILSLIYYSCFIFAQKKDLSIHLHSGKRSLESNKTSATIERLNKKFARMSNSLFVLIQFDALPTEETKKLLAEEGVTLLDYIPNNTYTVSVRGKLNQSLLKKARARAILEPALQDKMYSTLAKEMLHKGPITGGEDLPMRGSGYAEKLLVVLSAGSYASGVYMMKVVDGNKEQVFEIY